MTNYERRLNRLINYNALTELLDELRHLKKPTDEDEPWPMRGYIPPKSLRLPIYVYPDDLHTR